MAGHIVLEILMRHFFSTSTFVLDEFVGYFLAVSVIWALGYTLEHESLIRVDLVTQWLPKAVQNFLMALSAFVTAFCAFGLAMYFLQRADRAWDRGTVSSSIAKVPIAIPEMLMMIGLLIFSLQLVAFGLRHLTGHPSPASIETNEFVE